MICRRLKTLGAVFTACCTVFAVSQQVGCQRHSSAYSTPSDASRNPLEAQRLTIKAAELLDRSPDKLVEAETLLRQALEADLYHGPAHNNLGVIYLEQGQLYQAASEFEWARKLMPGHPDPRMNLAVTLERAGRTDDAIKEYASALEVYPEHLPTIQALARLQVRSGKTDEHTRSHLHTIALRSDKQWQEWARSQLLRQAN